MESELAKFEKGLTWTVWILAAILSLAVLIAFAVQEQYIWFVF